MQSEFGIVIQARMNSSRLPGKVLMPFLGLPLVIYKVQLIHDLGFDLPLVVATSTDASNDLICEVCDKYGIEWYRGDELNVFLRFQELLKKFHFKNIIRLTADNPFTQKFYLMRGCEVHLKSFNDLTTTRKIFADGRIQSYLPKGLSFDIINSKCILSADLDKLDLFESEHIIPYFFRRKKKIEYIKCDNLTGNYTIDTLEEFKEVESVAQKLQEGNKLIGFLSK